ncbi:MAG: hypothetical protein ACI4TD_00165 [Phocaeicola sp.]
MKYFNLFYLAASLSIMMPACDNTEDISGNDVPPVGALPSDEFTLNNLPDEPYKKDAMKLVTEDGYPFYSIELMPDGHYLLCRDEPRILMGVNMDGNGDFSVKAKLTRSRTTTYEDGTIDIFGIGTYGKFNKSGDLITINDRDYRTIEIDLNDPAKIKVDSEPISVIKVAQEQTTDATKSLCRTWNFNSQEIWAYFNGKYVAHGKQTIDNNRNVDTYFKGILGLEKYDFFDDYPCYKTVFTTYGTYISFYTDDTTEYALWEWIDEAKGIMKYEDSILNDDYDNEWNGQVSIRFKGNQMRVYEDFSGYDYEYEYNSRNVSVSTLTAVGASATN